MPVIWKMLMVAERRFRRVKSPGWMTGRLTGRSVRGRNCCHYNGIEGRLLMLSTHLLRLSPGNQPNPQIASIAATP